MQTAPAMSTAEEASALGKVKWFAIIQLAGTAAGWVAGFYVFSTVFFNSALFNMGPNPTSAQVANALGPLFQSFVYLIPLGIGIGLVGLGILTLGFRELAKVDRARFSIATPFMIVMMVGLLMLAVGGAYLLNDIPSIIANAPTQSGTPSSAFLSSMGTLAGGFALLGIGGLLAIIGVIGGLVLGLWRVGSRYNQTIIKIGAIFEIIPALNIVAPILIVLGAMEAKNSLPR